MPNDRYGTVGTCLGAGTGAGTVQVRYGYTARVRYMGTIHGYGAGTVHGYGFRTHVPYRPTVPMYRTLAVYPYRTCTVPAPLPAPKPVPAVPYLSKPLSKTPSALYVTNPIENMIFILLEISYGTAS